MKRLFDFSTALVALLLLTPLLLVAGAAIKATSAGPVLYRSRRVGRYGKPFYMYKLRTMVKGADKAGPPITGRRDSRVTPVGRLLRKSKLDELPSLWNVVRGDMSWVGPRPENEISAARYTEEQRSILTLRPGITSLATIKYRHEEDLLEGSTDWEAAYDRLMQDKLLLELEYLRRRSFLLDLKILCRTVLAIVR